MNTKIYKKISINKMPLLLPQKKRKKKTVKKLVFFYLIFLCIFLGGTLCVSDTYAAQSSTKTQEEIEEELTSSINKQLEKLDLYDLEQLVAALSDKQAKLFGDNGFLQKMRKVLSGDFSLGYDSFFSAIFALAFEGVLMYIPVLASIVAVCILCGILSSLRSNKSKNDQAVNLACLGVVVIIVVAVLAQLILLTKDTLLSLQAQMSAALPVLLTLMVALGANASVAVYQPAVAFLSTLMMQLLTAVVLPIFMCGLVLSIVGNLSSNVRLEKLSAFFFSLAKWIIGLTFTVFLAFLSVQGITASTHDGVSIRTAKYALSHYIPIVGGYLSEGFSIIMAGSMLLKNAVGFCAVLLLCATVLTPIIRIAVFSLVLRLTAGLIEPICDNKIPSFVAAVAKNLNLLIAIILGVAFMYFIVLMLIVCTGNYALTA